MIWSWAYPLCLGDCNWITSTESDLLAYRLYSQDPQLTEVLLHYLFMFSSMRIDVLSRSHDLTLSDINIKCPPPPQPAACHRRCLVTIFSTVNAVHLLRSCCPSAFAYPFSPPQQYTLEVFNQVQEGLVIASRQQRRGGGGAPPRHHSWPRSRSRARASTMMTGRWTPARTIRSGRGQGDSRGTKRGTIRPPRPPPKTHKLHLCFIPPSCPSSFESTFPRQVL
jgi:hypothetical protein